MPIMYNISLLTRGSHTCNGSVAGICCVDERSDCGQYGLIDALKVPKHCRRSNWYTDKDYLQINQSKLIDPVNLQIGPPPLIFWPPAGFEKIYCWISLDDLQRSEAVRDSAASRDMVPVRANDIDWSAFYVPYVPLQITPVFTDDVTFFHDRIKKHQDGAEKRFAEDIQKLRVRIMEISMREADSGFKASYTQDSRGAWSAQLRKLVKASDDKTKADQAIYVQGEYEPWE